MFWEIYQTSSIHRASSQASNAELTAQSAQRKADRSESEIRQLQRQVDGLALACQAMWELLSKHSGLTDEQLMQQIGDVDSRDGKIDGRIRQSVRSCPKCARPVNSRRPACIYCGETMDVKVPFGLELGETDHS